MMNGCGKSDAAIVASKPLNEERSAEEAVERRAEIKGNADQQSTSRTPSRTDVTQALNRIRRMVRRRPCPTLFAAYRATRR
jgi:hypothetical protein